VLPGVSVRRHRNFFRSDSSSTVAIGTVAHPAKHEKIVSKNGKKIYRAYRFRYVKGVNICTWRQSGQEEASLLYAPLLPPKTKRRGEWLIFDALTGPNRSENLRTK